MWPMKNQMVLVGAGELCTVAYAAAHIRVSERYIRRLVAAQKLARVALVVATDEETGPIVLYTSEVQEYAKARRLVRT